MDFTQVIAIVIASEFASSMVDALMVVSPRPQAGIHAILVRVNQCPWIKGVFDTGCDGLLLHMSQEMDHHLTATLQHAKDRRPFLLQCASSPFAFEAAPTSLAPRVLHHFRLPCMAGNHLGFIARDLV
jgi:hypothetical protein